MAEGDGQAQSSGHPPPAELMQTETMVDGDAAGHGSDDHDNEARRHSAASGETAVDAPAHKLDRKVSLQDQTDLLPPKQLIIVLLGLSLAIFLAFLDQTIVSTALPVIGEKLGAADQIEWVGTSYLLSSTAVLPLAGRLSDIFGRKKVLITAICIFMIGNALCTAAQSVNQLIGFRALTGVGGGIILTSCMTVVSDVVSLRKRGTYQGIIGIWIALAAAIGPLAGGGLAENASWRYAFGIMVPLSLFTIVVCAIFLPLKPVTGSMRDKFLKIDYAGIVTIVIGLCLLLLGINWGGTTYSWDSPAVLSTIIIGACLLAVFLVIEWKVAALPIIPLRLFANLTVSSVNAATFLTGVIYYCQLYYVPVLLQALRGATPILSGVQLLPLLLGQTTFVWISGFGISKTGHYRTPIIAGFVIWSVAQGLISTIDGSTSESKLIGYLFLAGVGAGLTFQSTLIAAQAACDRKDMAVVTSLRNFWRSVGGSIGLSAGAALLNNRLISGLLTVPGLTSDQRYTLQTQSTSLRSQGLTPEQLAAVETVYASAVQSVWYLCIPCAALAALVAIFGIRHHSLGAHDRKTVAAIEKRKHEADGHESDGDVEAQRGQDGKGDETRTVSSTPEHENDPRSLDLSVGGNPNLVEKQTEA